MFILLFITSLIVPAIMVGFGLLWRKRPPRSINSLYGYRTSWSQKSKETWEFAHKYIAKIWLYIGIPLGVITIVLFFVFHNISDDALLEFIYAITFIQTIILLLTIIPTEIELRKKFDKNGNRK